MAAPFKGVINVDIRDSEPDWTPFEAPRAPEGAPNVVYIVLDDVGFSACGCYGGPVEHLHGRQVAPLPRGRDEPCLDAPQLAERPRVRAPARVPRRRDQPVAPRPRLRQPSRRSAADARGGIPPH